MKIGPNLHNKHLVYGHDTGYGVANIGVSTIHYPGKPTTNLTTSTLTSVFSSWGGLVGTSTTYTNGYLGGSGVHVVITSGGGVNWWSSPSLTGLSGNTAYTVSATIKSTGVTPDANLLYIREYNSSNSQLREYGYFNTGRMVDLGGGWYRVWGTVTTQSATVRILLHGYSYSTNTNIKIQDLQFEAGSLASPWAGYGGSRSNTQGLIDLKNTASIDLSYVSFDSTAQPTFDGTNDYILTPFTRGTLGDQLTMIAYYKFDGSTGRTYTPIFGGKESGASTEFFIGKNSGNTHIGVQDGNYSGSFVTGSDAWDGNYHQIVYTYANGSGKIYLDGVLKNTGTFSKCNDAEQITVGGEFEGSGYYMIGDIPRVCVFDRVLTAEDVLKDFNANKNRFNI